MNAPLCKDCKHCVKDQWDSYRFAKCAVSRLDLIEGKITFCRTERIFASIGCGPKGTNFEPKLQQSRPWWAFWRAA